MLVSNVGKEPEDIPQADRLRGQGALRRAGGLSAASRPRSPGPGVYYLNRWAYIAYIIPTTNLTIDWAEEGGWRRTTTTTPATPTAASRRAQLFNPLAVISRDGFEMRVSVKVVIRVRPDQAPLMVAKIGSIENLIDHVIHPMIDSSFRNQASSSEAMNFMQDRADEQAKAEARTREELEKYHVECVSVLISQIILPQELMEIHTRRVIAAQQQEMFVEQQKAEAEAHRHREHARQGRQAARAGRGADRRAGRGADEAADDPRGGGPRARRSRSRARPRAQKILAIGTATAEAYEKQVAAVGQANLAGIEVTKAIAAAGLEDHAGHPGLGRWRWRRREHLLRLHRAAAGQQPQRWLGQHRPAEHAVARGGAGMRTASPGDDIPLIARIVSVADTYDAMTSTRPYRQALSHEAAIAELRRVRGTQLDPTCVDAFLTWFAESEAIAA